MPHPEETYGIAVEGDTLFGALPQEKKPRESVTRHFFHCPWRRLSRRIGRILSECSHRHHHCTQIPDTERIDRSTPLS